MRSADAVETAQVSPGDTNFPKLTLPLVSGVHMRMAWA